MAGSTPLQHADEPNACRRCCSRQHVLWLAHLNEGAEVRGVGEKGGEGGRQGGQQQLCQVLVVLGLFGGQGVGWGGQWALSNSNVQQLCSNRPDAGRSFTSSCAAKHLMPGGEGGAGGGGGNACTTAAMQYKVPDQKEEIEGG